VTCLEQATGRLRWRVRLPPESAGWASSAGLLVAQGRLFVPCPNGRPEGKMICLDMQDGRIAWMAPLGEVGVWDRSSPVYAEGRVVYGHCQAKKSLVQAWDALSGAPAWQVELNLAPPAAPTGCSDGQRVFFTAGREKWGWKGEGAGERGETVAIDARSGAVAWRSSELFGTCAPALFGGDKLLVIEFGDGPMSGVRAISVRDGRLVWRGGRSGASRISIGPDYAVLRGYGGAGGKLNLLDGAGYPGIQAGGQLGGDTHACGAVSLAPEYAFAITVGGLNVRDVRTGALVWRSPGVAPRGCVNATLANGRIFWPGAANGLLFCWEPEVPKHAAGP
jgi:outer membrane protein assembly factor BamB